jgi:hypothetical protein
MNYKCSYKTKRIEGNCQYFQQFTNFILHESQAYNFAANPEH